MVSSAGYLATRSMAAKKPRKTSLRFNFAAPGTGSKSMLNEEERDAFVGVIDWLSESIMEVLSAELATSTFWIGGSFRPLTNSGAVPLLLLARLSGPPVSVASRLLFRIAAPDRSESALNPRLILPTGLPSQ